MSCRFAAVLLPAVLVCAAALAQPDPSLPPASMRPEIAAGLGVSYVGARDLADLANSTPGAAGRVASFTSAVEFFGAGSIPLSRAWVLKLEYAYLLTSYTVSSSFGIAPAEYSVTAHLPSVILQYVVAGAQMYELKAGAGLGYHTGTLTLKSYLREGTFTAAGPSVVLDLEGDTAVSDHLYAYLDAGLRWEWMGDLTDSGGKAPSGPLGRPTSLHMFGPGAKIGVAYLF